ncbi:hypothetical protein GGF31_003716 [Allomyces arbusculus]|nr:hypothetical protein GGF31_003716 [Allomyces arbusculus]
MSQAAQTAAAAAVRPCEYKVGKVLGEGTYAKVKMAYHIKTGQAYACKIFNKQLMHGREHMVLNEINILKKVSQGHPNLIGLIDYFESANNLYLIMELCSGGELFYRICNRGHYFEADAARIVRTICDAVAYLHDANIIHRDLKPENLLFRTPDEDSDLMIADFGLARCLESEAFPMLTTTCGTPGFMSPEILQRKPYGKAVDLWAIGVIAYFLLVGYTPFDRNTTAEEIQAIVSGDWTFSPKEYWAHVSETAKDFIRHLLKLDPNERLTARQALEHPWLAPYAPAVPAAPPAAPVPVPVTATETAHSAPAAPNAATRGMAPGDLLPHIRANSKSAADKFRSAVRTMQAASHWAKLLGAPAVNLPMPVEEHLPAAQ